MIVDERPSDEPTDNQSELSDEPQGLSDQNRKETLMQKTVNIEGMMCPHCVAHATEALKGVAGVADAQVSLENKNAVVTLDGDVGDQALIDAIVAAGYKAEMA